MHTPDEIPLSERPREAIIARGPSALPDADLLALLLGTGTKDRSVFAVAKEVLTVLDSFNGEMRLEDLEKIRGVGKAKAALLAAALEFSRRRIRPEGIKVKGPGDLFPALSHYADRSQEHFLCTSLNGAHEVIKTRVITIGLANAAQVHPREVFADAITDRAVAVILAHNHPSGDLAPSREDLEVTRRLQAAGEILGIKVLDHIIFGRRGYSSLRESGQW
jgi:DNA repair protein RadC